MARMDAGSIDLTAAGTAERLSANIAASSLVRATDKIISIDITPRSDNSGASSYIGGSNVSSTYGARILKGVSKSLDFSDNGGVTFNTIWVDSDTTGDTIDWIVIW